MTAVLTYNPRRAQGDNLSLRVDDSVPGSRWRVTMEVYQPGSIGGDTFTVRAGGAGVWRAQRSVEVGRQRIHITARGGGDRCVLQLVGQVSRRPGPIPAHSLSAAAPCTADARVNLRLFTNRAPHQAESVAVRVTRAPAGSRWKLILVTSAGDSGTGLHTTVRADDSGRWRFKGYGESSFEFQDAGVVARDRATGERCRIALSGRVARR